MSDEISCNIYEYLELKLNKLKEEIGNILLEGDAYFSEWEAISKLFREIDIFLNYIKKQRDKDERSLGTM